MQILLEKFIEMENLKVEWIIDFKAHIIQVFTNFAYRG